MRIGCRKCGFLPRLAASRNSKVLKASRGGVLVINAIHKSQVTLQLPLTRESRAVETEGVPRRHTTDRLPIFASITSDQEKL